MSWPAAGPVERIGARARGQGGPARRVVRGQRSVGTLAAAASSPLADVAVDRCLRGSGRVVRRATVVALVDAATTRALGFRR